MKFANLTLVCIAFLAAASDVRPAFAQARAAAQQKNFKVIYIPPPVSDAAPETRAAIRNLSAGSATIALWNYSTTAYDGMTYQGTMVGRSPFAHGHRATTIPTLLVPVVLTFQSTGQVFDPTVTPDPCLGTGNSVADLIVHSPIFQNSDFVSNGVDVGSTQYLDAFQRANFWTQVNGTPYHTVFTTSPTVLSPASIPALSVTVPIADGSTLLGSGCDTGFIDINWWDNYVQTTLLPALASNGVNTTTFPQVIFNSVALTIGPNCCALGYHNAFINGGGTLQTYSVNDVDNSGAFGNAPGDTSVMSHEVAEWMDDPNGVNPVPAWGAEGQVSAGNCQNNLEVGDPLTGTLVASVTLNNFTYTLQELAFYSWFYGQNPSYGSGGKYSNGGTFTGFAKACPPGGTN